MQVGWRSSELATRVAAAEAVDPIALELAQPVDRRGWQRIGDYGTHAERDTQSS